MKTDISTFCDACVRALIPLGPALDAGAQELTRLTGESVVSHALPVLNDLRARVRTLTDKLESQQAYLLIFGPLKSGKSTLVNALSGAYVSEVTSLPGYPCLVYVQHGDSPRFALTRYNGRESVFASADVLKDVIEDSHVALAQQIHAAEDRGAEFDPARDFPESIRRVDVAVRMPSLSQSNTAIVDTPGLYSRMNFGYDVLTREFRNSAACAVFVVKTDNLFLEQVFTEFDQLLALFSRIFLVINVDASKRDLQCDGTLLPSAESAEPEKVVQAFTTLSMSGPLRQAYAQNRVRIHALDLLNAASSLLQAPGSPGLDAPALVDSRKRFDAFTADLTEYLNSSEYTQEFLRDSLHQARLLCAELRELAGVGEIRNFRDRQDALALEMRILDHRIASVDRLSQVDWPGTFEKFRGEATTAAQTRTDAAIARVTEESRAALERWYATPESLKELEEQHWDPVLVHAGLQLAEETRAGIVEAAKGTFGGARPTPEAADDLHRIGVNLGGVANAALEILAPLETVEPYLINITIDEVPIAKGLGDWLLFRRTTTLRRRIFGEDLGLPVLPEEKRRRLPDRSREALRAMIGESVRLKFSTLAPTQATQSLYGYVEGFCGGLQQVLQHKREQFQQARQTLQREFDANAGTVSFMQKLEQLVAAADGALMQLEGTEMVPAPPARPSFPPLAVAEMETAATGARQYSAA